MANSRERRQLRRLLLQSGHSPSIESASGKQAELIPTKKRSWKDIPRRFYGAVGVAVSLVVTLLSVYPWLSVEPGQSLDVTNPFQTEFTVSNEGYIPLTDVSVKCAYEYETTAAHAANLSMNARDFVPSLWHSQKVTIPCRNMVNRAATPLIFRSARLRFTFDYAFWHLNLKPLRRSQTFSFSAVRGFDGLMHWEYGEGTTR